MTNCGDVTYDGVNKDLCRKHENCELPLGDIKGDKCTCKFGYSMRKDKTCGVACTKTLYNPSNTTICTGIDNCINPANNVTGDNCTCTIGLIVDRLGKCNTTCGNTTVKHNEKYTSCTDKIGCRPPNYNVSNDTINTSG